MSKLIYFDIEARNKMKKGVDTLANAVKVTLGPKGRNVVIEKKFGAPQVTKDGVTVAKEIELEDPIENMGAQMVKEVASKTADIAGDGTTTATVLAQSIISEGLKMVAAGANPMDLKRGIDKAVSLVVQNLQAQSQTVGNDSKKIQQVATISANNDETIGKLIAEAFAKVGVQCFNDLNGMFALAIWDKEEEKLYLVRDRVGIKPLYYFHREGQFAFASELKALFTLAADKKINSGAVADFLYLGYIPGDSTIYHDFNKLKYPYTVPYRPIK